MDFNTMVLSAKKGDKKAMEDVIESLMPAIYKICSSYYIKNYDMDDLMQISKISVINAVNKYNFNSKANFKTYANTAIENNLKYLLRGECKRNYEISSETVVEEGVTILDKLSDECYIEEDYCRKESYNELYKHLYELKPIYRNILLWIYIKNGNIKDYAAIENISIEACRKRKARAINLLRKKYK